MVLSFRYPKTTQKHSLRPLYEIFSFTKNLHSLFFNVTMRFRFFATMKKQAAKIYKQRRCKPYQANGKTTFNLQNIPGVYLIYKGDEIVYIGFSGTNLYKTLYRHFQKWDDPTQIRVTYRNLKDITVRVVYTTTKQHAYKLEKALIHKYKPKDNPSQYESYEPTKGDIVKLDEYLNQNTKPIAVFEGDIPF